MKALSIKPKDIEHLFTVAGFEINKAKAMAFSKSFNISLNQHSSNQSSSTVMWEGLYGQVPETIDHMITGICLWDSRWKIEFLNKKKASQPGAVKVLSLEIPRTQALEFLDEGRTVKNFIVPRDIGKYHSIYLSWLQESIPKLNVKHIFMHVPETEYHLYIKDLEVKMKRPLPELHQNLSIFAEKVREPIRAIMKTEFMFPI